MSYRVTYPQFPERPEFLCVRCAGARNLAIRPGMALGSRCEDAGYPEAWVGGPVLIKRLTVEDASGRTCADCGHRLRVLDDVPKFQRGAARVLYKPGGDPNAAWRDIGQALSIAFDVQVASQAGAIRTLGRLQQDLAKSADTTAAAMAGLAKYVERCYAPIVASKSPGVAEAWKGAPWANPRVPSMRGAPARPGSWHGVSSETRGLWQLKAPVFERRTLAQQQAMYYAHLMSRRGYRPVVTTLGI